MDEEITIIDGNTRTERIKKFFFQNKKILAIISFVIFIVLIGFFYLKN